MTRTEMKRHLKSRNFNLSLYSGTAVTGDSVTFPLWNLSGQMVGYQVYRPDKPKCHSGLPRDRRYYTYVSRYGGKQPAAAVWGLETWRPDKPLFLCEGVFDACRLHNAGISAIAVLGADPTHLKSWLSSLPNVKVAVVQGDAAGQKLAKYGDLAIHLPDGKDVGDLAKAEFKSIFADYIVAEGPKAFSPDTHQGGGM